MTDEIGWLLLAEDAAVRNMAPDTQTLMHRKQGVPLSALTVDRVIQHGVPTGVSSWM